MTVPEPVDVEPDVIVLVPRADAVRLRLQVALGLKPLRDSGLTPAPSMLAVCAQLAAAGESVETAAATRIAFPAGTFPAVTAAAPAQWTCDLTTADAARLVSLTPQHFRRVAARLGITPRRVGGAHLWAPADVGRVAEHRGHRPR